MTIKTDPQEPNPAKESADGSPSPISDSPQSNPTPVEHSPPTGERTFSQSDVDRIVKDRLAKDRQRRSSHAPNEDELKTLKDQNAKLLQQNSELSQRLSEEQSRREQAEQHKRAVDRDTLLRDALSGARCTDVQVAERYLQGDIAQNPDGEWIVRTPDGKSLPISAESIAQVLPNALKKPSVKGGSGVSGPARTKSINHQLQREESKLAELRKRTSGRPGDNIAMVAYAKQKRLVDQLRRGAK